MRISKRPWPSACLSRREFVASSLVYFFVSALVLAVATAGAAINFTLIAILFIVDAYLLCTYVKARLGYTMWRMRNFQPS